MQANPIQWDTSPSSTTVSVEPASPQRAGKSNTLTHRARSRGPAKRARHTTESSERSETEQSIASGTSRQNSEGKRLAFKEEPTVITSPRNHPSRIAARPSSLTSSPCFPRCSVASQSVHSVEGGNERAASRQEGTASVKSSPIPFGTPDVLHSAQFNAAISNQVTYTPRSAVLSGIPPEPAPNEYPLREDYRDYRHIVRHTDPLGLIHNFSYYENIAESAGLGYYGVPPRPAYGPRGQYRPPSRTSTMDGGAESWRPNWPSKVFSLSVFLKYKRTHITIDREWDDEALLREINVTYNKLRTWRRFFSVKDIWCVVLRPYVSPHYVLTAVARRILMKVKVRIASSQPFP